MMPLVGFRSWCRTDGTLRARCSGLVWNTDGPTEALCGQSSLMTAKPCVSLREHECGLYAFYGPDEGLGIYGFSVAGAVVAGGRTFECEHGFRAQYARPIALVNDDEYEAFHCARDDDPAEEIAARYDIPVLSRDELVAYAGWFGELRTGAGVGHA